MMNAAFRATGIDAVYLALRVSADRLGAVVRGLCACEIGGVNVTAPHKGTVGAFLDDLSSTAKKTRSVNTIVFEDGRAVGHSTDGEGLVGAIETETGTAITGATILMIGAGGAARGVLPALMEHRPGRINITNRTEKRAAVLAGELDSDDIVGTLPLKTAELAQAIRTADIVINATAIPITTADFLGLDLLTMRAGALVFDMNYGTDTRAIRTLLKPRTIRYCDGLTMLLFQGFGSFRLWTRQEPPISDMRQALGLSS